MRKSKYPELAADDMREKGIRFYKRGGYTPGSSGLCFWDTR